MGKRAEIILENGILSPSVDDYGSMIYTSVGYSIRNEGASGPNYNKQDIKEAIERYKKSLIEKGYSPVVLDKRAKINKGELTGWMQDTKKIMKILVKWRWANDHKKFHHRIEWINHSEFGDMLGKKGYCFCCSWEDEVQKHDFIPLEETIKRFIKENEMDCEFEIEEEYEEGFCNSDGWWAILEKAQEPYKKLVEDHGFEKNSGFTVYKTKEINSLYLKSKDQKEFLDLVKKCVDLHYECGVRKWNWQTGDFIEEGYEPEKHDDSAENILKIK